MAVDMCERCVESDGGEVRVYGSYRGYGEPLIGFWPYFLHEYSSAGMSETLELIAGALIVVFTRFFLRNDGSISVRFKHEI